MPRRNDLSSVLVIGSGPIVISQACEFDYSGTQACRVLKEEGLRVILVNSNPTTIMTDPGIIDATYVEPTTPEVVASIIEKERPNALLPMLGGQTTLDMAVALSEMDILECFNVELTGASIGTTRAGEDREELKEIVERSGAEVARSFIAHTMEKCHAAAAELGYPLVVRPSFTMGGSGSDSAYTPDDLERIAGQSLATSITTEVLLEELILGWEEYELELIHDKADNVVVVCSIENVDPVGVHTGDSIMVAPALTLTDREMQRLRDIGIAVIRAVGMDTDGCNIQFAIHPETGRIIAIEMNPRVPRSSALAPKATGFPVAKIVAQLATDHTLDEIPNDITGSTPVSFEPTLDYMVVKVPRFTFEKFSAADPTLITPMKAVGEAMAIGRLYTETLQKTLRSINKGGVQFHWDGDAPTPEETRALVEAAAVGTGGRLVQIQQAIRGGTTLEELFESTKINPWFFDQLFLLDEVAARIREAEALTGDVLAEAKRHGFSDRQIAAMRGLSEDTVREVRGAFGIHPVFRTVDTRAAEFATRTPYYYSTYDQENEVRPRGCEAVIILGASPNRIGQGIEFDYSYVHAAMSLREHYEIVIVDCNPETVSTDYDISDRLYFESLTLEGVLGIYRTECTAGSIKGMIVQPGGQAPLSLAANLECAGVPILGTSPHAIDLAENREEFGKTLEVAQCPAPTHDTVNTPEQVIAVAEQAGYPVLVRPSFVPGGRGMVIINDEPAPRGYLASHGSELLFSRGPLLIDRFLDAVIEIDVDVPHDGKELFMSAIMEHIEGAGIHSGDSSCVLPPMTLSAHKLECITASTKTIARGIGVRGLINIRFALLFDMLYVIEASLRVSHTVSSASKAAGVRLAKAAALVQVSATITSLREEGLLSTHDARGIYDGGSIAVKAAVLPFKCLRTAGGEIVDIVLGPEMRSMGEVMGIDRDFPTAFAKFRLGASTDMPMSGTVFISIADTDKRAIVLPAARMHEMGFNILATSGTASVLRRNGIEVQVIRKSSEGRGDGGGPTVVDFTNDGSIDMVVNTPQRSAPRNDGYQIRAAAASQDRPAVTTPQAFNAMVQTIEVRMREAYPVRSLQEWDSIRSEETR